MPRESNIRSGVNKYTPITSILTNPNFPSLISQVNIDFSDMDTTAAIYGLRLTQSEYDAIEAFANLPVQAEQYDAKVSAYRSRRESGSEVLPVYEASAITQAIYYRLSTLSKIANVVGTSIDRIGVALPSPDGDLNPEFLYMLTVREHKAYRLNILDGLRQLTPPYDDGAHTQGYNPNWSDDNDYIIALGLHDDVATHSNPTSDELAPYIAPIIAGAAAIALPELIEAGATEEIVSGLIGEGAPFTFFGTETTEIPLIGAPKVKALPPPIEIQIPGIPSIDIPHIDYNVYSDQVILQDGTHSNSTTGKGTYLGAKRIITLPPKTIYVGHDEVATTAATDKATISITPTEQTDGSITNDIQLKLPSPRITLESGSALAVTPYKDDNGLWATKLTIPSGGGSVGTIDQPPTLPDMCCSGQWITNPTGGSGGSGGTYTPIVGGGTSYPSGPYVPLPPPNITLPPTVTPPNIPQVPNTPTDVLGTCYPFYTNGGNGLPLTDLTQVVANNVNVGNGIQSQLNDILGVYGVNKTCSLPLGIMISIETERLTSQGLWPNILDPIFSRPIVFSLDNQALFTPVPVGHIDYPNTPLPLLTATEETYTRGFKYFVPVKSWDDISNLMLDFSFVQLNGASYHGLNAYLCGVRIIPNGLGLPISTAATYSGTPIGGHTADSNLPFGSFYIQRQSKDVFISVDYASGEGATISACSRNGHNKIQVDFERSFNNAGSHVFTGSTTVTVQMHDRFGGTPDNNPKWTVSAAVSNAQQIVGSVVLDFSALTDSDWSAVTQFSINVGNSDENQQAGQVIHYYIQAYWI